MRVEAICSCHNIRYLSSHFVVMTDQHAAVLDHYFNDLEVCIFGVINSTGTRKHREKLLAALDY